MNLKEFKNSKWFQEASNPGAETSVAQSLPRWLTRVKSLRLVEKAEELWDYITKGKATASEKILVLAGLLYLISPLDVIPDAIPVIGWLDDLGVATYILNYLTRKISGTIDASVIDQETVIDVAGLPVVETEPTSIVAEAPLSVSRLEWLRQSCDRLGARELVDSITALELELQGPVTQVLFAGRYNVGKSTLLNALLEGPWLPVGPVPTTKAISYVIHGSQPALATQDAMGETTIHPSPDILGDRDHPAIRGARSLILTLPTSLLKPGLALVDSPGLEDPDLEFSQLTLDLAPTAALIVLVLDATVLLSRPEREFVEGLLAADRDRKLIVVINKADRLSQEEQAQVTRTAAEQLKELECAAPIIMLSAKEAFDAVARKKPAPVAFQRFLDELRRSMRGGLREERKRYMDSRVASLEASLKNLCEVSVEASRMDQAQRDHASEVAARSSQEAHEQQTKALRKMEAALQLLKERTQANFRIFFEGLDCLLVRKIDEMSLDLLKNTEELAILIRLETKRFAEAELQEVHTQFGKQASEAIYDLQTGLAGLPIGLKTSNARQPISAQLIPPAILVVTFPLVGFFTWIYLAAGIALGRNVVENLYSSLMATSGLSKIRSELISQLRPKLREFEEGTLREIERHFASLVELARERTILATGESIAAVVEVVEPDRNPERLLLCTEILNHIEPTRKNV